MRIGLIGEGTYPVSKGGVSTWTDQLLTRLPDHEFAIVTLVGHDRQIRWDVPHNVTDVTLVSMWDPIPRSPRYVGQVQERSRVRQALSRLWSAALPGDASETANLDLARGGLRTLADERRVPLSVLLSREGSAEPLLRHWTLHRSTRPWLPPLTLSQAAEVARIADRMLGVMDAAWPAVDVLHIASNGPAALLGLVRHWRDGTPIVLTEHGIYLRERYIALTSLKLAWPVRYALMRLITVMCQLTYAESAILAPVSHFNAGWERRLGADDARIVTVHNGADTSAFSPITTEPDVPTVSFVGRIDPLKDLHTLIGAFALVHQAIPAARLRLFGPTPVGNEAYHAGLLAYAAERGLTDAITFEGGVPTARPALEAGHVVALSSISEGLPFTVIEAMMSGRATVNTDVGGVAECTGRDGTAGIVVPPRDPEAFAAALIELLTDDGRRQAMGAAARERAHAMFDLSLFERRFREIYDAARQPLVLPPSLPGRMDGSASEELVRPVPARRFPPPVPSERISLPAPTLTLPRVVPARLSAQPALVR